MIDALINARWPLKLPDHRAEFHHKHPWWEAARLVDMYATLTPGSQLVDIGSEEGDLTALYASWGARVSFIDPSGPWMAQTKETFLANALTPEKTYTGFAGPATRPGGTHPDRGFATLDESVHVRATRLDEFAPEGTYAISMDVEGYESHVMQGATNHLPALAWVSVHGYVDPHAEIPSEFHRLMREYGYEDQFLAYDHEWHYRFWRT